MAARISTIVVLPETQAGSRVGAARGLRLRRAQRRERNSVRTRILYATVERATNGWSAKTGRRSLSTFHSLRRTYAALLAELGEHPAITAAHGHRDPRMTLRIYTDVTGMRPQTHLDGLLAQGDWRHSSRGPMSPARSADDPQATLFDTD